MPIKFKSLIVLLTGFTDAVKPVKGKKQTSLKIHTVEHLHQKSNFMLSLLKSVNQLASFLGISVEELQKLDPEKHYVVFQIPKPGKTEKRTIEAPTGLLRNLLDRIADGLQWIYSDHRTHAAQGYVRSVTNDPDKRTIFTNATKHLGKKYLLNIDLESFFYQVTETKVMEIFSDSRFFSFDTETEQLLTKLVCYNGRLPMGSSTSPALSNFATFDLDNELTRWASGHKIVYTRFVDDLSFSSNFQLNENHFEMINDMLRMHRFSPNPNKIKWYGATDTKEVTGLIVGNKITLPDEYLADLEHEFNHLKAVKEYALLYPDYQVLEWIQKLERVINGRLAFVQAVYGYESKIYQQLLGAKDEAEAYQPEMQSISWRYSGYEYFTS